MKLYLQIHIVGNNRWNSNWRTHLDRNTKSVACWNNSRLCLPGKVRRLKVHRQTQDLCWRFPQVYAWFKFSWKWHFDINNHAIDPTTMVKKPIETSQIYRNEFVLTCCTELQLQFWTMTRIWELKMNKLKRWLCIAAHQDLSLVTCVLDGHCRSWTDTYSCTVFLCMDHIQVWLVQGVLEAPGIQGQVQVGRVVQVLQDRLRHCLPLEKIKG